MKTITMMQLRAGPGEIAHEVSKHGETFLVTSQGKPVFKITPVDTIIMPDGKIIGPKPLTFGIDLGGEYAN